MGLANFIQGVKETVIKEYSTDELKQMLAHPDMRPCDFDHCLEAWLYRISLWGNITIKHNNPENGIQGEIVNQDKFLDTMANEEDNQVYGLWSIDQKAVNRLVFYRRYLAYDGKNYTEEFDVEVKLKDSLQKALDNTKRKGIFGWFKK
jgi:hypothetical protein